jgi:hypothetical protein
MCLRTYHRVAINDIVLLKSITWATPWCAVGSQTLRGSTPCSSLGKSNENQGSNQIVPLEER